MSPGASQSLDTRALLIVLIGHGLALAWLSIVMPSADIEALKEPIFAKIVTMQAGPAEPAPEAPAPAPVADPVVAPARIRPAVTPVSPPRETRTVLSAPSTTPVATELTAPMPTPSAAVEAPALADAEPADAGPPSNALPGDPDDVRRYVASIMRQLQRHKSYPRALKKAKTEGTVVLQFTIDRDGRLLASSVQQGSGHVELDRAALEMLARASPLPPIPEFMNRETLALAIPVEYSLITDR